MAKLTREQETVLGLTAASLFGKELNIAQGVDWQAVLQECVYQSVILLTSAAAKSYAPADVWQQWSAFCTRIIAGNVRVEWEHTQLHQMMTRAEIPYVVMKGCASSAYYPDPALRAMGDVDFLVRSEDIDRADKIMKAAGFANNGTDEENIHIAYHRGSGVGRSVWEMHWRANGIPEGPLGDEIIGYLSTAMDEAQQVQTPVGAYMGPSVFHHGLIMLLHTATHLINTGVGLRHLCDWAVFAASMTEEEFCRTFEEKLKKVGLWRFARLLTQLSSFYLGAPEAKWAGKADPELLEAVICDIFAGGNFGRKDEQRINQAKLMTDNAKGSVGDGSMLRQLTVVMNQKARMAFPACARYAVLLPAGWLYVGVRHILRILKGERPKLHVKQMISGAGQRRDIYKEFSLFDTQKQ